MWGRVRRNWDIGLVVGVLAIVSLPYVLPIVDAAAFPTFAATADLVAVSVLLLLLLYRGSRLAGRERAFWWWTSAAYGGWWLAELLVWLAPERRGELGFHLVVDCSYLLFFVLSLLAAEQRPDKAPSAHPRPNRWIEAVGLAVIVAALAVYFVVLPIRLDPEHYGTWISSSMLYSALDLLLGIRYLQLSIQATSVRWRSVFGWIAATMGVWALLDAVTAMIRVGWLEWPIDAPAHLWWHLPVLTFLVAIGGCRPDGSAEVERRAPDAVAPGGGLFRSTSPLILVAFLLPMLHGSLSALDLLDSTYHQARDWVVVVAVAILGSLLFAEHRWVRAAERAEAERRKRLADQALRASEERFRTLAEASFEGVIVHDGTTILDANEQLARIFDYPLDLAIGAPLGIRVAKDSKETLKDRLRRAASDQPFVFEAYDRQRRPLVLEARARDLPALGDGMRVAVLRDITQQRHLEASLRQAQKMEAVGRFAGGIAHDFNNLLTIVLASCDLASPATFEDDVQQIREAAERGAAMTRQLLAFSRQQRLALERLDLNAIVRDTEPMLRRLLPEHIEIDLDLDPAIERVEADPGQIGQVVLNLAINGRDAMPSGGRLAITTRAATLDVEAALRLGDDLPAGVYVRLSVADSGVGIPAEVLPQIFDPFFTTKDRGQGTGLGLATVHGIVLQTGGGIVVESEPGRGTTFEVYLPVADDASTVEPAAADEIPAEVASSSPSSAAGRVLVVEDERALGEIVCVVLRQAGFEVRLVAHAEEAMAVFEQDDRSIDLLITDVMLPGRCGPELVEELEPRWPDLAVLYMSGYAEGPWIDATAGRPLLEKPFDGDQLLTAVRQLLDPSDPPAQNA